MLILIRGCSMVHVVARRLSVAAVVDTSTIPLVFTLVCVSVTRFNVLGIVSGPAMVVIDIFCCVSSRICELSTVDIEI